MTRFVRSHHALSSEGAEEGQALILFAFLLPVLIGIMGVALDGGNVYYQRRHLQSMADAAAIAGAQHGNFNEDAPGIVTPDAWSDAIANATANGAVTGSITYVTGGARAGEVEVYVPPITAPYSGYAQGNAYVEVVVTRQVAHWFMPLLGIPSSPISARAVARSFSPGYAEAALLALNKDALKDGLDLSGCGAGGCSINGDVISHGGIKDTNGQNMHIDGSSYAYNGNAGTKLDVTGSNYGPNDGFGDGLNYYAVQDPVWQGENSLPRTFQWPTWPTICGDWDIYDELDVKIDEGCGGNVTVKNNERAEFSPGLYTSIDIQGGVSGKKHVFGNGVYEMDSLTISGGDSRGDGVLFKVNMAVKPGKAAFLSSSNANFTFGAYKPYSASNPPPVPCSPYACNTWLDIVIYAPNGDVNVDGAGDRVINGSIYAPKGHVAISGNNTGHTINGRVIAQTIKINGAGGAVNYMKGNKDIVFGPVLVNTP